jgi:16S rRNA (adenine1518-N6/adenine1519-N6)-dimethyltransferase
LIRARKRFGQNFLEPAWVQKVVRAIAPGPDETFLEIGPGHGALTRPLAERVRSVVVVEIDRDLAADLIRTVPPHVAIIQGDFLKVSGFGLQASEFRVVGNLPYNVASPILFKLRDMRAAGVAIRDATVMLQREVADRLTAAPGTRDYGVLTVLLGHAARVERLLALPPGAFRPAPKVHSALVRLTFHAPTPPVRDAARFERVVRAVFTRRRKTLANALHAVDSASPDALARAELDGRRRPETLTVSEFARLSDAMG